MMLTIYRSAPQDGAIIGRLAIDGVFTCYTLEGVDVAIPLGTYRVAITFSQRFQRDMPELLGVPGRTGIRIHPGNTDADTHGCILVGQTRGIASVQNSRLAFNALFERLQSETAPITIALTHPEMRQIA